MTPILPLLIVYIQILTVLVFLPRATSNNNTDQYAIIIDAGSTGSRAFIFKFLYENNTKIISDVHKGKKVEPGLSSVPLKQVVNYLLPLFKNAEQYIPESSRENTFVYIKGTAGMRLLPTEQQESLWDTVLNGLNFHPQFSFHINKEDLGTIDGHSEAFYAVLSSNYIEGSINAELKPQGDVDMVGAFDMGGSSTQLIFYTGEVGEDKVICQEDFWSYSWLNYGVEKIRERMWQQLIDTFSVSGDVEESILYVPNPCTFINYEYEWNESVVLKGTGNSTECVRWVRLLLWPSENITSSNSFDSSSTSGVQRIVSKPLHASSAPTASQGRPNTNSHNSHAAFPPGLPVDGVRHPPLQGRFYGMSVYFYALDCIRALSPLPIPHWPTPRIDDLEASTHAFCHLDWSTVQSTLQDKHRYTRNAQLPYRCLEALYIVTLLEHGFGFHGQHRRITLALDVKGIEVEWTLGFALAKVLPTLWSPDEPENIYLSTTANSSADTGIEFKADGLTLIEPVEVIPEGLTLIEPVPLRAVEPVPEGPPSPTVNDQINIEASDLLTNSTDTPNLSQQSVGVSIAPKNLGSRSVTAGILNGVKSGLLKIFRGIWALLCKLTFWIPR